jgi:cell wall-associated NlpC family hydrolase
MNLLNKHRAFLYINMIAFLVSCNTIQKVASSAKTAMTSSKTNKQTIVSNKPYVKEEIEFLDNLSVTPGKVFIKRSSIGIESETASISNFKNEIMPSNLSEVEQANWLQLKYSIKMDVAVESINNISLLKKIDEWYGTPYNYGGSTKNGVDCSYFTLDVMQGVFNINLKRTAAEQYEQTSRINWEDLKEGDLIFFKTEGPNKISHVGIYLSNNKFVHSSVRNGVTISDLSDPYYQRTLYSMGRLSSLAK